MRRVEVGDIVVVRGRAQAMKVLEGDSQMLTVWDASRNVKAYVEREEVQRILAPSDGQKQLEHLHDRRLLIEAIKDAIDPLHEEDVPYRPEGVGVVAVTVMLNNADLVRKVLEGAGK